MSQSKTTAQAKSPVPRKNKDRWDLPPARAGYVRGRTENLRRSEELCDFGQVQVIEFDLRISDDVPPVPVRMVGTDFTARVLEGHLVDIADPDPTQRPLLAHRFKYPNARDDGPEVVAHFPGRYMPSQGRGLFWLLVVISGPIVFVLGSIAVLGYVFHIFN